METVDQIIAEMREWANGEGCFNDDPEGEPLPCVYWAQRPFLAMCDRLEAAAKRERAPRQDGTNQLCVECGQPTMHMGNLCFACGKARKAST